MKVIEEPRQATTDLPDAGPLMAEALIKEARRHRRRRHLAYVAVTIVVIAVVAVAVVASRRTAHNAAVPSNEPKVGGPPMGRVVSLKLAGPLAVGPNGALYVVDEQRHEVLVRLANGQFRVVAGDGKDAFSGDGGPATKAALSNASIAVGTHRDIYVGSGFTGWSVYKVTPTGVATDIGYARRSGGNASVLSLGLGGVVEADNGMSIVRIEGNKLVTSYTFNNVPGTDWFTLTYFAVASNGTVYADDIGGGGFQRYQQLASVAHDHVAVLWQHRNAN